MAQQAIDEHALRGTAPATPSAPTTAALGSIAAMLAGLAAAWIATGCVGLLAHPLRAALTWLAMITAVWAVPPRLTRNNLAAIVALLASGLAAAVLVSQGQPPLDVFAVAILLVGLACGRQERARTILILAAEAVIVLGLFRLAYLAFPLFWQAANAVGSAMGALAGRITGRPLWVGETFAGLDYLVTTCYLAIAAPIRLPGRSGSKSVSARLILGALAIVFVVHLIYLCLLTFAANILHNLPEPPPPDPLAMLPGTLPTVSLGARMRKLVPWNLIALGAVCHLLLVAGLFSLLCKRTGADQIDATRERPRSWRDWAVPAAAILLGALLPIVATRTWRHADLTGKKIVFYEKGFLNWLKPEHGDYGRLSIGMYGLMPLYLESFGAECVISAELSPSDLEDADAVVVIYPNEPWQPGQLERIWAFVRAGGSLMVMGEHTVSEKEGGSRFNDLLEPTAMRVRFDSSMFAVGGWLQSYDALAHPTMAGVQDTENDFGVVIGATVEARPPARPFLVGRWGWADPGDESAGESKMGNGGYDAGEKLGDLVLAAEQPLGDGKVIVFGDTSNLSNGLTIGCHEYTSRLFAYVSSDETPMPLWRQMLGVAFLLTVIVFVSLSVRPSCLAALAVATAASLSICTTVVHQRQELVPRGELKSPRKLAYIDASHLGAYSRESWRPDGLMGLCMTLMRDNYLTLMLPEVTAERLGGARLLVSVAPSREFSSDERKVVREFVEGGGILICTVGYDRAAPAGSLLDDFGFQVGYRSVTAKASGEQPRALGHFKSPFFNAGDYLTYVRFHAGWPLACRDKDALLVCYYPPDVPLITVRRHGSGLVAVVSDTCFAMNKNLEHEGGEPFEGMRENAHFWRWFLALLEEGEPWYPPKPEVEVPAYAPLPMELEASEGGGVAPEPASDPPEPASDPAEQEVKS